MIPILILLTGSQMFVQTTLSHTTIAHMKLYIERRRQSVKIFKKI